MDAERLMLVAGIAAFALTIHWVRSRELRERYAIGWISLSVLLLIAGLFPDILKRLAELCHLQYPSAVLFLALGAIYTFSFFVTVSLSHEHRRSVRLSQEVALLEQRVRMLEAERDAFPVRHEAVSHAIALEDASYP
ncbi:MAG TPA: DUF2304 domain-containing protein [Planctomycetaceae bacterium]|nr:DUF2304 domain-containing protein [Planctomycetaceae bacterium]